MDLDYEEYKDNLHVILNDSILENSSCNNSLWENEEIRAKIEKHDERDSIQRAMRKARKLTDDPFGAMQTFIMPEETKEKFTSICLSNGVTPSAFLRAVCSRLVKSYYG